MTLTIELPESLAERASSWSREELSQVAADAVAARLLADDTDDDMTEIFDDSGKSVGFVGQVTEEWPMDNATRAALLEARADHDAGRFYTPEEVHDRVMKTIADWTAKQE